MESIEQWKEESLDIQSEEEIKTSEPVHKRPKLYKKLKCTKTPTKASETNNLSNYNKKQILNYLKTHGCSAKNFGNAIKSFKYPKHLALEYFNKAIRDAEQYVHQECDSLSFDNNEDWVKLFKSWNIPEKCYYEPAIVMNVITNTEEHPDPKDLNGIDLKSIYKFLTNALLGLPQPELNKESAIFLSNEFEMLVNEANTLTGDEETRNLRKQLQRNVLNCSPKSQEKISLDPLLLDDNIV